MEVRVDLGLGLVSTRVVCSKWKDTDQIFAGVCLRPLREPQQIGISLLDKQDLVIADSSVLLLSHNIEGLLVLKGAVDKAIEQFKAKISNEPKDSK